MPPSTAWATVPTIGIGGEEEQDRPRRAGPRGAGAVRSMTAATSAATARMTSTKVSRRLPNSMYLWNDSACSAVGAIDPSTHSGQVGHPRPDSVIRTMAPVTTMPVWATRLAT